MAQYKKEDIIDAIVKMRTEKMASTKTIIKDFLMGELGYGQSYSYDLLREARNKIVEYYKQSSTSSVEEAIGQLEEMAEIARKDRNYKLAFEIRKELSKIQGHYIEKIELNGQLTLNTIKLKEVYKPEDDK